MTNGEDPWKALEAEFRSRARRAPTMCSLKVWSDAAESVARLRRALRRRRVQE